MQSLVEYLNMNLFQIYCRVGCWKNFENRLIFSEVMAQSLVSCFFDSRCRLAGRWKGVKWISCVQAETASLPRPLHQRHTLRCHHFTELTCRRVRWSVSSASHAPVVESQNVSKKHDELPSSFRMSSSLHLPPNPVYRSAMNQHTQWHAR